jgi:hypothetical protein
MVGWATDHWQPVTTSSIKAMVRRGGDWTENGDRKTMQYLTKEGVTVTVWEFSDDRPENARNR